MIERILKAISFTVPALQEFYIHCGNHIVLQAGIRAVPCRKVRQTAERKLVRDGQDGGRRTRRV